MDRSKFFGSLRARGSGVFGTSLSKGQVSGMDAILDEAQRRGTRTNDLAYMLATAYLETAHTMQPIKEIGGEAYFTKMYDIKGSRPAKARELGNMAPGDGAKYAGRGFVQLTGKTNYARASKRLGVDLVNFPDRVMELPLAVAILFTGMADGWFTGKKLSDYINDQRTDYVGARRIINGTDKADTIAGYARAFEKAIKASGYLAQAPKPRPVPQAAPPARVEPVPAPKPVPPVNRVPEPAPVAKRGNPLAALWAAVIGLLAGGMAYVSNAPCEWLGWFCGG